MNQNGNGHTTGDNDTLATAKRYVAAGISVIPSGPEKLPAFDLLPRDEKTGKATWDPYQTKIPSDDEIERWFGGSRPQAGIARVHGAVSGHLETLDFDPHSPEEQAVIGEYRRIVEEQSPGLLARLTEIDTPRPGTQFCYRCETAVEGNLKLAFWLKPEAIQRGVTVKTAKADDWQALIETRGEGGYAVCPGTEARFHPKNCCYLYAGGPELTDVATITVEERNVLLRAARMFDRKPAKESPNQFTTEARKNASGGGVTVWDDFNARNTWPEILLAHSWEHIFDRGEVGYWKRPGGSSRWSATVNFNGNDLLHVFSTSTGLDSDKSYSRFAFVAFMDYGGDFKAATKALAAKNYGTRLKPDPRDYGWDSDEAPPRPISSSNGAADYHGNGQSAATPPDPIPARPAVVRFTARQLIEQFPRLNDPIIGGLLRAGETFNVISVSKIGKSWLLYALLLSIITGRPWLGRFTTTRGRVLLVDNELHKPTLANRLKTVARAMEITEDEYADDLDVWPLRGDLRTLAELRPELESVAGLYQLVAIDAKYRMLPPDVSENDNASETLFYNSVDQLSDLTGAGFGLVHHSSKGSQSDKRVTDVGSGAGAQSRAADCHLILREHEDDGCVVLDAAVRSFEPVQPFGLRWEFPLWIPDASIDPTELRGKKSAAEEKQAGRNAEADGAVLDATATWASRREIRTAAGMNDDRTNSAIARLLKAGFLETQDDVRRGNKCEVFRKSIKAR